jgi:hypothetical protein
MELIEYMFAFLIEAVLCNISYILGLGKHIQNNDITPGPLSIFGVLSLTNPNLLTDYMIPVCTNTHVPNS